MLDSGERHNGLIPGKGHFEIVVNLPDVDGLAFMADRWNAWGAETITYTAIPNAR